MKKLGRVEETCVILIKRCDFFNLKYFLMYILLLILWCLIKMQPFLTIFFKCTKQFPEMMMMMIIIIIIIIIIITIIIIN